MKGRANPARVHRPEWPAAPGPGAFTPPARKLKPVEELTEYVQCLKETRCQPATTGENAAQELGYSRLFASVYEEVRQRFKTLRRHRTQAGSDDLVADFAAIGLEKRAIVGERYVRLRDGDNPISACTLRRQGVPAIPM